MLSGYSEEAVAATGTVSIVFSLFSFFFTLLGAGAAIIISNLLGADKIKNAQCACFNALVLCVAMGLCVTAVLFILSPVITGWMNLTGTVQSLAIAYTRIRVLSLPLFCLTTMMLAQMRCYGFPKPAVITGIVKNILNLAVSFYAVNFATHPYLSGVHGVALGCLVAELAGFCIVLTLFWKKGLRLHKATGLRHFLSDSGKFLKITIPTYISGASFTLSQIVTNAFTVLLGVNAVSGKIYFTHILSFAYLCSSAVGNTNSVFSGRLYGAGRKTHADRLNRMLLRFTIPANLLVSLLILTLRTPLLGLFTDNPDIFQMALPILLVDILIEQARAFSHVYEYSLRGFGDVTPTMIVTFLSGWIFGVGLSYVLCISCRLGLVGCWIGLAADETVRALFTCLRWKLKKQWQAMPAESQ